MSADWTKDSIAREEIAHDGLSVALELRLVDGDGFERLLDGASGAFVFVRGEELLGLGDHFGTRKIGHYSLQIKKFRFSSCKFFFAEICN